MPSSCCIQYVSKSGRPSSGLGNVNPHPSSQEGVVPKNVLTIGQLHPSPLLVRSCLKSCMLGFSIMQTKNFQMSKLGLEKEEEPEIKLPTFSGLIIQKAKEVQKKTPTSISSTTPKPLTVWIIINCGKF